MDEEIDEIVTDIRSELLYLRFQASAMREYLRDATHDSARWGAYDKRHDMLKAMKRVTDYDQG